MVKVSAVCAILLATSAGGAAMAQGPGPQSPEQRAERFEAADTNDDGQLDKAEFVASLPERAQDLADQIWERIDEDGDGAVTKEQFVNMQMRRPG